MELHKELIKQRIHYLIEHGGVYPSPAPAGRRVVLLATALVVALVSTDVGISIVNAMHLAAR